MTAPGPSVVAVIDVGSTSVHALVASVDGDALGPRLDESAFLGLGPTVAADGRLGHAKLAELVAALADFTWRARGLGATSPVLLGTEPLRRARDARHAVRAVERGVGAPLHVLSHSEEALLALLGATAGRRVTEPTVVVDVGGGSTEIVMVAPPGPPVVRGLRLGSAPLTADLARHDPPTRDDIEAMIRAARARIGGPSLRPRTAIAVGGTADNLLRVARAGTTGGSDSLTIADLRAALDRLSREPGDAVAARYGVRPVRARSLPAGGAIVLALLEGWDLPSVRVSCGGLREGAVRAVARAGAGWRDGLGGLARGWRD